MPSVVELKNELRSLGLSTAGNKADLEERLRAHKAKSEAVAAGAAAVSSSSTKRGAPSSSAGRGSKAVVVDLTVVGAAPAPSAAGALFNELAKGAENPNELGADETLKFCERLGVDPESADALYVSYKLGSTSMGVFPRAEFVESATKTKWRSVADIRAALPAMRSSLAWGRPGFSDLYGNFTYKWGCEVGQKVMKKETAAGLWKLLVPEAAFPELPRWLAYVSDVFAGKAVSRDVWTSFPRWIAAVHESGGLQHFKLDEADAWPVLIDEFVEHVSKASSS